MPVRMSFRLNAAYPTAAAMSQSRTALLKVPAFLLILALLAILLMTAQPPARAQDGGHWVPAPCDPTGKVQYDLPYDNGFLLMTYGALTGSASNTYPAGANAAGANAAGANATGANATGANAAGANATGALSPSSREFPYTPGPQELSDDWLTDGISLSDSLAASNCSGYGAGWLGNSPLLGTAKAHIDGTASAFYVWQWQDEWGATSAQDPAGSRPPDHLDVLVRATLSTSEAMWANWGTLAGPLTGSATARDNFGDTHTASLSSSDYPQFPYWVNNVWWQPSDLTAYHLVRASTGPGGVVEVDLTGHEDMAVDNEAPYQSDEAGVAPLPAPDPWDGSVTVYGPAGIQSVAAVAGAAQLPGWGSLNGTYINEDAPGASSWSPLPNPLVLYGGSEPSTSDALWLQAGDNPLVPGTTYTWYGPSGGSYSPPVTSTNPNWIVGPLSGIPSILNFQCLLTYPNGSVATKQTNVEVGVRTDDVALVGWIDKLGVPGGATGLSTAGVNPQIVSDLPPVPPFGIAATQRIGELSCNNDHTDYDESDPATIMSAADRDYCLDWMFIYAANPDPAQVCTTLDPTLDYSLGWNGYSDFRDPGGFMNYDKFYAYVRGGANYKLVNHFQVKYRVNPATGQFNGVPTVLHQDALVGTTINPAPFPPASVIPAQYGPMNGAILTDPTNTRVSLVDDGSPDVSGIRAFNTLEGLDVATPLFWENIGSEIEFKSPGWGNASGWGPSLRHQPYPTYNIYYNGKYQGAYAEASSPSKNFTIAPYPFGTVPSTFGVFPFTAPTIPGGRNGDASSPPDPTVIRPSSQYTAPIP